MIVVVGSRHDPVANRLVETLPKGALCSAEDLSSSGWVFSDAPRRATWVVEGETVDDAEVSGVFVRRTTVYPEELLSVHPDDRSYLAAEMHAFLIFVLATTWATVANPVGDGALGEELFRPERWMAAALAAGQPVAPIRLTDGRSRRRRFTPVVAELVGDQVIGDVSETTKERVVAIAKAVDVNWATFVFDGRHRLISLSGSQEPSPAAIHALGQLLSHPVAA